MRPMKGPEYLVLAPGLGDQLVNVLLVLVNGRLEVVEVATLGEVKLARPGAARSHRGAVRAVVEILKQWRHSHTKQETLSCRLYDHHGVE